MAISLELLVGVTSADPQVRSETLSSWQSQSALSRDDTITQLIAAIRSDRKVLWNLETEEYTQARSDADFNNSAAQQEIRGPVEENNRLLTALLQEEVDRAAAEVEDQESFLRLARMIVRQCQGWRYGGWGDTPVYQFLAPALAWAEGAAPAAPWRYCASFLVAGCPVADVRDATFVTTASP